MWQCVHGDTLVHCQFDKKDDDSVLTPPHILDWDMSQISLDDVKDYHQRTGLILEAKEDPDDESVFGGDMPGQLAGCCGSCRDNEIIESDTATNAITESRVDGEIGKLRVDLEEERDKYRALSVVISDLYALVDKIPLAEDVGTEGISMIILWDDYVLVCCLVPTCSGDRPSRGTGKETVVSVSGC